MRPARTPAGPPPARSSPVGTLSRAVALTTPVSLIERRTTTPPNVPRAGWASGANPTAGITKDPWAPPDGWMDAPEQGSLVCDVFVPSKVPLSDRWFARVPPERRYGPAEALAAARVTAGGRPVELVVDLTNSSRYYDPRAFESAGASYPKVACVGKDAPPDPVAVTQFVYVVGKFLAERAQRGSNGVILVHCTHGYNRTGAMLVHHMQRARSWPKLNEHVAEFAQARGRRAASTNPSTSASSSTSTSSGDFARRSTRRFRISSAERRRRTRLRWTTRTFPRMICLGV